MKTGEKYLNKRYVHPDYPDGVPCERWWASDDILVGGSIQSKLDALHLVRDFGITHVISVESEHSDDAEIEGVPLSACRYPFQDIGGGDNAPQMLKCLLFAHEAASNSLPVFYVHCQQGGSRSPAVAWLLLYGIYGLGSNEALQAINVHRPEYGPHPFHKAYLDAAITALQQAGFYSGG